MPTDIQINQVYFLTILLKDKWYLIFKKYFVMRCKPEKVEICIFNKRK